MQIDEILNELEKIHSGIHPQKAILSAIEKKNEMIPCLIGLLEKTNNHITKLSKGYYAHIYAMLLLSQFQSTGSQ